MGEVKILNGLPRKQSLLAMTKRFCLLNKTCRLGILAQQDKEICHAERQIDHCVSASQSLEKDGIKEVLSGKRVAFTLAEVLITLGIIGVVAAMTMPTLIQNHKREVVSGQLKKFYSAMSQAVILAESEHGVQVSNWDAPAIRYDGQEMEAWFNKYLKNHLNVIKTEVTQDGKFLLVYLSDGSGFKIFEHGTVINQIHVFFYPNMKKNTGVGGIDSFSFRFINDKFSTYAEKTTASDAQLMSTSYTEGCHKNSGTRHTCSTLIQRNGWKIPDNYPFRF